VSLIDPYPVDQNRIIQALERRVAALEAQIRNRPGAPVTEASGPLFLPNSSPSTPAGGCKVYAVGGDFRVINSNGVVRQIPGTGAAVGGPSYVVGDAPSSYTPGYANTQSAAINDQNSVITALLASLRNADIIDG
jgi:hypothetical protein